MDVMLSACLLSLTIAPPACEGQCDEIASDPVETLPLWSDAPPSTAPSEQVTRDYDSAPVGVHTVNARSHNPAMVATGAVLLTGGGALTGIVTPALWVVFNVGTGLNGGSSELDGSDKRFIAGLGIGGAAGMLIGVTLLAVGAKTPELRTYRNSTAKFHVQPLITINPARGGNSVFGVMGGFSF